MTIHHRKQYRTHMLSEAVVAQQIIRSMNGSCSDAFLEESFEDLRVNTKTGQPRWLESYEKAIRWVLIAGMGAAFFPIGIQLLFLAPELTFIAAALISVIAKSLSSLFTWAAKQALKSDVHVKNYVQELNRNELKTPADCVNKVEELLNQGGILGRLMKYFRSSAEISIPAISFLVGGAVTLGIASLSFLGMIVHLSPVLTSVVAVTSGLCFLSGLILWPRNSYKNADMAIAKSSKYDVCSSDSFGRGPEIATRARVSTTWSRTHSVTKEAELPRKAELSGDFQLQFVS